MPLKNH